jgi:hypothetical protein
MLAGCSRVYDLGTPEMKARKALQSFYIMRSDDGQIGIIGEGNTNDNIDGVNVAVARSLTAAIAKELSKISTRFSAPDELARESSEMYRTMPPKFLSGKFYQKDGKKYIFVAGFSKTFEWKPLSKEDPYFVITELNFSCAGDTEQVCTQKMTDASMQVMLPKLKKFLADFGY